MGLVAIVKKFARVILNPALNPPDGELGVYKSKYALVTTETSGPFNQDVVHFADAGDDSQPLLTDLVTTVGNGSTGGRSAVGYVDQKNEGVAGPGEKRIYGRDADGGVVNEIHLKSDGSILMRNVVQNAILLIDSDGDFNFSGGKFIINGQEFATHTHQPGTFTAGGDLVTGVSGDVT